MLNVRHTLTCATVPRHVVTQTRLNTGIQSRVMIVEVPSCCVWSSSLTAVLWPLLEVKFQPIRLWCRCRCHGREAAEN